MPNQPKTPIRTVRIDSELWEQAQAKAQKEGRSVTEVIRECLKKYVKQ